MWWPHTMNPSPAIDACDDHGPVAEDGLARMHAEHVAHDPHGRQDHHVDRRVAVEPEQVLPEQRLPSLTVGCVPRREQRRVEAAVDEHEHGARGEHGQGEKLQQRRDHKGPDRQRQPHGGEPRRAHLDHGHHVVERAEDAREAGEGQREQPPGLPGDSPGRIPPPWTGAHRRSSPRRRAARRERGHGEAPDARNHQPERERVHAREGHVGRTDHQRDQVVPEGPVSRDDHEEGHDRAGSGAPCTPPASSLPRLGKSHSPTMGTWRTARRAGSA